MEEDTKVATTIVLVSGGYPESFQKGYAINGVESVENALVFHAGTAQGEGNNITTNGGRVIAITALDDTLEGALALANRAAEQIHFERKYYRRDIGKDLM
jgi:phosphoribosylamine--glycine ligase